MEGSVTLWLPDVWPLQKHRHPWGRTYREGKLARCVLPRATPSFCPLPGRGQPAGRGRLLRAVNGAGWSAGTR